MSYDDIVTVFMSESAAPQPQVPDSPARRLRDSLEPIATQGWWSRPAAEAVTGLGLGFLDGYLWGRAASLGTPTSSVVTATFGVFEPVMVDGVYALGTAAASRDDVLAAREAGAAAAVGAFADDETAAAIADPLLAALGSIDGMGRPLFSGLRGLPLPASPAGRLWRAAELVREHRGDGHLAAAVAAGLTAGPLNVLTEVWLDYPVGEYSATRGMSPDAIAAAVASLEERGWLSGGSLTDAGRAARDELEATTDRSQQELIDVLGGSLDDVVSRASAVSAAIVAGRSFPTDPRKRAAG